MKVPCKDCENRHTGCHSECALYQAYHAEREAVSKERLDRIGAFATPTEYQKRCTKHKLDNEKKWRKQ